MPIANRPSHTLHGSEAPLPVYRSSLNDADDIDPSEYSMSLVSHNEAELVRVEKFVQMGVQTDGDMKKAQSGHFCSLTDLHALNEQNQKRKKPRRPANTPKIY